MSSGPAPARGAKTILLTTFKRDGTAVATPVNIAFDRDRAFFRSHHNAGKTRLRNNPRWVRGLDFAGQAHGAAHPGSRNPAGRQARIAAPALARATGCCREFWSLPPIVLLRYQTMEHYELMPDAVQAPPGPGAA